MQFLTAKNSSGWYIQNKRKSSYFDFGGDHRQIETYLSPGYQYTFQVQSCQRSYYVLLVSCSAWSPGVTLTTATNSFCQDGYVWRMAAPFDQTCVTLNQWRQVLYDNSQAASRVGPYAPLQPHSCIAGYVWRQAFGGDYVCVTPAERSQVFTENVTALSHIISL